MRLLSIVWAGLRRRPVHISLTFASAVVAFFLFGVLQGVDGAIKHLIATTHVDRLYVINPSGQSMPFAYKAQIAAIHGISATTFSMERRGYFRAPSNPVIVRATEPSTYSTVFSEQTISDSDKAAFLKTRTGALVTPSLANDYGWKRGQTISIHIARAPKSNGSMDWSFNIVGFFFVPQNPDNKVLLVNYDYVDSARASEKGTVGQFQFLISDPQRAPQIANTVDNMFLNSAVNTRTQTERDLIQSQMSEIGDIDLFVAAIISAVFFTLLLLVGMALMQSFRHRIREFAVLKTIGFSDRKVAFLIFGESILLCVFSAVVGISLASFALPILSSVTHGSFPPIPLSVRIEGLGASILLGLISGAIPAWKASQLSIADALAHG